MTPQERQLVDDLFDRLSKLENAPRDPDAIAAISDGLRKAPGAVYALTQTVLLQDEALKRAHARIQELEAGHAPEPAQSGGFLDSMRDTLFGGGPSRGSVPNVPPRDSRPTWNSGQAMQQGQPGYGQPPAYGQGPGQAPGQGFGAPPVGGATSDHVLPVCRTGWRARWCFRQPGSPACISRLLKTPPSAPPSATYR